MGARTEAYLREIPADAQGWRLYDSREISEDLGTTSTAVAVWTNYAMRRGLVEVRRLNPGVRGSHITHLRFMEVPRPQDGPQPAREVERSRPIPLGVAEPEPASQEPVGFLPVPTLAGYARALKLAKAQDNPMVQAVLSERATAELLHEAVRLYWWARASHRERT